MQNLLLRIIDIIFSLLGIVCGLPLIAAIFTLGLLDTGSPLYFQQRVGKNEKLFTLIKFRTMYPNTSSTATHLVDSSNITKLGRFLRKTKLDELPQLFNVLTGDMSLVGPRPCLPNQHKLIQERKIRNAFTVRPGITGLAQVNNVDMSTPKKLARYDHLMVNTLNLKIYFCLIIYTIVGHGSGDRVQD